MNLKKCRNKGHWYDADKYTSCPYCNPTISALDITIPLEMTDMGNAGIRRGAGSDAAGNELTERRTPGDFEMTAQMEGSGATPLEEAISRANEPLVEDSLQKTVSFYKNTFGVEPVVGWLTCIEGMHYGKSYTLRSGKSFIGRLPGNDVVLEDDFSVSREKHAIVIYDPKAKKFLVQPGSSRELFYVNDDILLSNQILEPYDVLTIGDEKLLFIPLCGERFCWEDQKKKREMQEHAS